TGAQGEGSAADRAESPARGPGRPRYGLRPRRDALGPRAARRGRHGARRPRDARPAGGRRVYALLSGPAGSERGDARRRVPRAPCLAYLSPDPPLRSSTSPPDPLSRSVTSPPFPLSLSVPSPAISLSLLGS